MTELEKEYLNNTFTAGWFQWFDLENRIEYPECHVLIYKTEYGFMAEVLDFPIMVSGESCDETFSKLTNLAKEYLENYRNTKLHDGIFKYESSKSEFWAKFREIYTPMKMNNFLNTDRSNKDYFPFDLYKENLQLKKIIKNLTEHIENKDDIIKNLEYHNNFLNNEIDAMKLNSHLMEHTKKVN